MLPENISVTVTDVLNYHQKQGHFKVAGRSFSAMSLRLNTNGKYIVNNKIIPFKQPSICIIPEDLAYERISLEDDVLVIHFKLINCTMENIEVYEIADTEKYRRLFEKALQLRLKSAAGAQYSETAVLYEILGELAGDRSLIGERRDYISETAEYMKQNFFNSELTIESLAKRANVSPAQYRRRFRQLYGKSPKQYLDNMRFSYAKSLLETGYFSQKEIAFRCGFSSVEYFRTAFKKESGYSVSKYCSETKTSTS